MIKETLNHVINLIEKKGDCFLLLYYSMLFSYLLVEVL